MLAGFPSAGGIRVTAEVWTRSVALLHEQVHGLFRRAVEAAAGGVSMAAASKFPGHRCYIEIATVLAKAEMRQRDDACFEGGQKHVLSQSVSDPGGCNSVGDAV